MPIEDLQCTCLKGNQKRILINAVNRAWLEADKVTKESEALRKEFEKDKEDYVEMREKINKIPLC